MQRNSDRNHRQLFSNSYQFTIVRQQLRAQQAGYEEQAALLLVRVQARKLILKYMKSSTAAEWRITGCTAAAGRDARNTIAKGGNVLGLSCQAKSDKTVR